jgi:ubiquinone/menaquinone biosynthesis C-methylase UbiE
MMELFVFRKFQGPSRHPLGRAGLSNYNPQSFDHLADEYDFVASLERSATFFLQHLPQRCRRVLDVGCGTGILAYDLARHVESVLAIDISEPMLVIARTKRSAPNIEYYRADANHLLLTEKFDAIVSHTTFHHLSNIPATVQVLKNALERCGRLIFVDNVARFSLVPRHPSVMIARAYLKVVPDLFRFGGNSARRLLRFRTSRHWLDHLKSDQHFPPGQFRKFYGQLLPGSSFTALNCFMGVVWESPAT